MMTRVQSIGFTVSDMDQALQFYTGVLPFTLASEAEVMGGPYERLTGVFGARLRVARLTLGDEEIQLTQYLAPPGGRPIPPDSRSNDLWFQHIAIVVSDMDAAYTHLREHKVQHVSTAPQTLPESIPAAAGIKAFYFRDPDGHNLELIGFPPGKGPERWQSTERLFLGIDHTAMAVRDTDASRPFYEDTLSMPLAGESLNFGTEQEHLNGVFGCRVRISGFKAEGPGIEFLEYLTPPGGRPTPPDLRANDLAHWVTTVITPDLDALDLSAVTLVSGGIVDLPDDNPYGLKRAVMIRDCDGHAVKLAE